MIELNCPKCDKSYKFKDEALSKSFECGCGRRFIIEPELELEDATPNKSKETEEKNNDQNVILDNKIKTTCPECQKVYHFKPEVLSKKYKCNCGHAFIIEPDLEEEDEAEKSRQNRKRIEQENVYTKGQAGKSGVDLGEKKVCSKCKAVIPKTAVECPQCNFNTLGIKYDKQKREELSFEGISLVVKYGKWSLPLIIVLIAYWIMSIQESKMEIANDLQELVVTKLDKEKESGTPGKVVTHYKINQKAKYITARKIEEKFDLFSLGSGWLSLAQPGIKADVHYKGQPRPTARYFIWNEDKTALVEIKDKAYNIEDYTPLALEFK